MTKSAAKVSKEDSRRPPSEPPCGVHELVARSSAWQVRAIKNKSKVGGFATLRNLNHTTRANIAHEKAEQIRARIVCTPAESARRGLTHMRSMCVGVAETGHRGSDTYTDGTIKTNLISLWSHPHPYQNSNHPVSATPTAFASQIGQFPRGSP